MLSGSSGTAYKNSLAETMRNKASKNSNVCPAGATLADGILIETKFIGAVR
jgi:hypothetical protein